MASPTEFTCMLRALESNQRMPDTRIQPKLYFEKRNVILKTHQLAQELEQERAQS